MEHRPPELNHLFYYTLDQFCERYRLNPTWVKGRFSPQLGHDLHFDELDFQIIISEFDLLHKCGIEVTPMLDPFFVEHEDPRKVVKVIL